MSESKQRAAQRLPYSCVWKSVPMSHLRTKAGRPRLPRRGSDRRGEQQAGFWYRWARSPKRGGWGAGIGKMVRMGLEWPCIWKEWQGTQIFKTSSVYSGFNKKGIFSKKSLVICASKLRAFEERNNELEAAIRRNGDTSPPPGPVLRSVERAGKKSLLAGSVCDLEQVSWPFWLRFPYLKSGIRIILILSDCCY